MSNIHFQSYAMKNECTMTIIGFLSFQSKHSKIEIRKDKNDWNNNSTKLSNKWTTYELDQSQDIVTGDAHVSS